jgi:hypothetical protein
MVTKKYLFLTLDGIVGRMDGLQKDINDLSTSIEFLNAQGKCLINFVDAAIDLHEAQFHAPKPAPKKGKK